MNELYTIDKILYGFVHTVMHSFSTHGLFPCTDTQPISNCFGMYVFLTTHVEDTHWKPISTASLQHMLSVGNV